MVNRLVLIDGNAILHRAYHALPPLTTSKGQLVNAVFGFCSMLLKVIADLKPTHLLVCFDRPEPTFRQKLYASYQAQRPKMEEELSSQIDLLKKVIKTMEIPIYELAGYEADDLLGTLAREAGVKTPGVSRPAKRASLTPGVSEVVIVTGDRDILQLVDKNIKVYMPIKGLSLAKLYGEKEVEEKFGLSPKQIVDYKALIGDQSDNYPGVKGIGPETAKQLLLCFKTLEQIYQNLEVIKKKVKISDKAFQALIEDKKNAKLAKKLAQIVTDTPVKLDLKKARFRSLDKPQVKELFAGLEFKSLIKRLSDQKVESKAKQKDKQSNKEVKKLPNQQLKLV